MNIKHKFLSLFFTGLLSFSVLMTPVTAYATTSSEAEAAALAQQQSVYEKTIESNEWESWPAGPAIYAESAIVMEAETGTILYAKDIDQQNFPASITKIMTALVTLENCALDEDVYYSYYATHSIEYGSSSIARTEDEVLTVEESLYGMMLSSANECANALAEHVAGSTEAFAELMNARAAELGCTNTHFTNPNGLHDPEHYTSAHDMALITRAAVANADFRRISGTDYYTLRATNKNSEELLIQNHHYMISSYRTNKFLDDTVFAGKTGYTTDALNTLVTCATRNGMDLIVVTMRTQSSGVRGEPLFSDTAALLDYAANNFQKFNISENESTFTVDNAYSFDSDSSAFESSSALIEIDPEGFVILPSSASFSDAVPSLSFEDGEESSATISYEYAGQTVGAATISLRNSELSQYDFSATESGDLNAEGKQTKFITINLKVIFTVIAVVALLILAAFALRRFLSRNMAKIRQSVNAFRQRRLHSRRRYRRRTKKR